MQKYHRAKFEVTKRGKKSKYYTCSVCGFRCWAFIAKDAHGQHKAHLTSHALDGRESAASEAVSSPEVLSTLQAVSSLAIPQVM